MPDTYTTNLNLTLPEVGASRDTWGAKTNDNWNVVDEFLFMAMPIGAVLDFAGTAAPDGWLICDGRWISRTTYSALFAVIGTYWGAGDGATTFGLPNTSGRSVVGPGQVYDDQGQTITFTLGTYRGAVARPIAQGHLPAVAIATDAQGWHGHTGATYGAGTHAHSTDVQGYHSHGGTAGGGLHAHLGWTDVTGAHQHNVPTEGTLGISGGGYSSAADGSYAYRGQVTDVQGSHSHNIQTYEAGTHSHSISGDGSHGHNISTVGDHAHNLYTDGAGSHQHTITLGSGTWFDIMAPVVVVTKIIYAGSEASTRATRSGVATTASRRLAAPARGRH